MLKFIGGTFLLIGAVIGGGILAIPIVSAKFGFLTTIIAIILTWLVMTKTGLYILSLSLNCPKRYNTYYSIVGNFLGEKTQLLTVFLFLWLLYFSLSSYISGCVSMVMASTASLFSNTSYFNICMLFVLLFGSLITISAKFVIRLNVLIVIAKLSLLLLTILAIFSHPTLAFTFSSNTLLTSGGASLVMIIINSFGYQFIIPSLVTYYGDERASLFKGMIICSTTAVLVLYITWLYTIYSIIPLQGPHGLLAIYHSNNQLLAFNQSLQFYLHSKYAVSLISIFESVALFGSFFCVSLGIFDFLLDVFKTTNRWIIGFATFLPPLGLTLFSENMYIYAMSLAGYIAIILEIIIPFFAKRVLTSRLGVQL
ncbi:MAG: aromatic amino acid transport family protein [Legionellaceae bacterium]|nr:aromatic amino acid transport family protein [Legionellaceae bacterium]